MLAGAALKAVQEIGGAVFSAAGVELFSILEARVNLPMSEWRIETVQASRAYVSIKFGKLPVF